ncbi:MAG: antibiotic biosynthesis monooxygenase [Planctomycetes bacterium]|jgi:heme-degrading monooxygenase HmoA|nr:antibiotic biosynthesis monooxygenase [Planctomycetota bacterium]
MHSSIRTAVVAWLLALPACTFATGFRFAPGVDPTGAMAEREVVVALTHAVLKGTDDALFFAQIERVVAGLAPQPGYVGHSLRSSGRGEAWTMTVWTDEDALDAFVASRLHREAIAAALVTVDKARFHRYRVPMRSLPPDWSMALAQLESIAFDDYGAQSAASPTRP